MSEQSKSELDLLRELHVYAVAVLLKNPKGNQLYGALQNLDKAVNRVKQQGVKSFDIIDHLYHQMEWSEKTFGPGERSAGVVDHIRKELDEILENPTDLEEWIDVIILGFDGAWRAGYKPWQIIQCLTAKQQKNEHRDWPDWRDAEPGSAIEHIKHPVCTICGINLVTPEEGQDTCDSCMSGM